ncbi:MAG TPA: alpha-L-fucosidase, partial [Acidobacteriaceae bacterium]
LLLALACFHVTLSLAAQQSINPSAEKAARVIDEEWRTASSKYDAPRAAILDRVTHSNQAGPYSTDWQSLGTVSVPEWYRDAKFGIFIHWGVYSVPAFGSEWYPRNMYTAGSPDNLHQVQTYGPLTKFGYKDFIPMFKADKYDPAAWARLFAKSGAKYVVPVFEHHDGFAMYNSDLSDWTAAKMGPHRDLAGDLAKAVRAEGMHLGASSHRVEHDWFLENGRKQASDLNDPAFAQFYGPAHQRLLVGSDDLARDFTYASDAYLSDWLARSAEIVEKYHPDIMYFDWWIGQPSVRPYLAKFASFYYNQSKQNGQPGVINYKMDAMAEGSGVLDIERGALSEIRELPWQTDTSISNKSWGYIEHDTFKSPEFVVHQLVDIVSKNGNLLMNIGPRSDGTIPDEVQQVLLSVGEWLSINGEAIYGTRPWTVFGEGPTRVHAGAFHDADTDRYTEHDFRFTTKGRTLYAIELGWPQGEEAVVHSVSSEGMGAVKSVRLLGSSAEVPFEQKADGLHLRLPKQSPSKYAAAFRITFK